ncbi:MAG: methylenetetrahydrofolate reductase [NAD(P)H] [Lachnospiraceae bacterium]|nr:methylenetetrahydrofolate reductase [NAD(P)H] [Lachnospiraceae bacterium]
MKVSNIYKEKNSTLSFEIFPPKKDEELKNIDETLSVLCELQPDFISVTFGAGGSANCNRTIEIARKIRKDYGIEPVVHLTCLHYDKKEIDEFASALEAEGIENILALRGDASQDVPAKDVFRHSSDLISYLKKDHDFCFLGACYPECHPDSRDRIEDIKNLKKKNDAGAEVLLSQMCFDNDIFFKFSESCRIAGVEAPVIPGIMPVIKASQIRRMVDMCGVEFPDRFRRIIDRYEDKPEALFDAGMSYALSQVIDLIAGGVPGIHLYTMNKPQVARRICEGLKNIYVPAGNLRAC